MTNAFSETPVEYLKGVGPGRAKILSKELRIKTFGDLLLHYPFRYVDRTRFSTINELTPDSPQVQLKGLLIKVEEMGFKTSKRLVAVLKDDTGLLELVWFKGISYVKPKLQIGREYLAFGKPSMFQMKLNMVHPDMELFSKAGSEASPALEPVYPSTEKLSERGLNSKGIGKLTKALVFLMKGKVNNVLPDELRGQYNLLSREESLRQLHLPQSAELLRRAINRMKFEEFFFIQLMLLRQKNTQQQKLKGIPFLKVGDLFHAFYKHHISFELTGAQKRVIKEIRNDMGSNQQMNRLLQGDVGSGKTMVALLCSLIAMGNGYQVALMAPTETLASQHAESIGNDLNGLEVKTALLTGSTKAKQRKQMLEQLAAGEIRLLIGTHALLEDRVVFKNLGLVIIDEQHRFGVAQRARLWKKNTVSPHVLVMTATPIPRTLAMTLYGDLDVSVIDEMPPGRKPVKTIHRKDEHRLSVFQFMREQIAEGRQVYVVYPLIKESEKMDYKDLMDGYESISRSFPLPDYRVSIVHGQMKAANKAYEMQQFVSGQTQIMVATTVIEVGVNVPNASVMVVESAERFGLSQLHQLRGRVGRGTDQAFCILMTGNKLSAESRKRIKTMVGTTDGFKIAEADLELRGPGDLSGTQQSGLLDFKIADLTKDANILTYARKAALELLEQDPGLQQSKHQATSRHLAAVMNERPEDWSRIS